MSFAIALCSLTLYIINPIRPRGGGGGGGGEQEMPALTLSVNNFFDMKANATQLSDFS